MHAEHRLLLRYLRYAGLQRAAALRLLRNLNLCAGWRRVRHRSVGKLLQRWRGRVYRDVDRCFPLLPGRRVFCQRVQLSLRRSVLLDDLHAGCDVVNRIQLRCDMHADWFESVHNRS